MGEVYLVRHPRLPRLYALKTLSPSLTDDDDFRRRFGREAELAAELSHPHIVGVHDRGEFEGRLWIAMDYVDGVDASQLLRERYPQGMPEREVNEIVTAVADALDYAHGRQLLHRDVKPANILLDDSNPNRRRILLADFGVARRTDDVSGLTATNTTVGSVAYAAPEQLMGKHLDGRADQYALAATAFHLLTGNPPFQHSNPAVVISGHLSVPPPPLGQSRPELGYLDPVLARGMAKNPDGRYTLCRDFADALVGQAVPATVPAPKPQLPPAYAPPPANFAPPPANFAPPPAARPPEQTAPYWDQPPAWEQPPPTGPGLLRPAVLIPVALVVLLLLGAGAFGVVQLVSSDSTPTTSATRATATPAPSRETEPSSSTLPSTTASSTAPSPPSTSVAPPPPPTTPTTVSGIGSTKTIACNDGAATVSGIQNTVTITGHCLVVTVSGQGNKVTVDNADSIQASGINNVVTYHTGTPTIGRSGIDNTVQQG
jgi:serine/threonine-protein kinase